MAATKVYVRGTATVEEEPSTLEKIQERVEERYGELRSQVIERKEKFIKNATEVFITREEVVETEVRKTTLY